MATVFAANSSGILIDNEPVEGVRSLTYRLERELNDVYGLGSDERIAVYYGAKRVRGELRVASVSETLDGLAASGAGFQIVANLAHAQSARSVSFDECHIDGKEFGLGVGSHAEAVYSFSCVRVREEDKSQPATA